MRNAEFGIRNLDSQSSITHRLQKNAISTSVHSPRGIFQQPANLIVKVFRNPQSAFRNYIKVLLILCVMFLIGCGYQMVGKETHVPPGITSIAIAPFVNQTLERGIEIPFTQGFLREFILGRKIRVVDRSEADSILEGTIKSFNISSVSYNRSGFVMEYQTDVVLDLTLKKRTGEVIWEEKGFSESRWFRASSNVLINEVNRADALQQIGRFVAERIRNRFFYNF